MSNEMFIYYSIGSALGIFFAVPFFITGTAQGISYIKKKDYFEGTIMLLVGLSVILIICILANGFLGFIPDTPAYLSDKGTDITGVVTDYVKNFDYEFAVVNEDGEKLWCRTFVSNTINVGDEVVLKKYTYSDSYIFVKINEKFFSAKKHKGILIGLMLMLIISILLFNLSSLRKTKDKYKKYRKPVKIAMFVVNVLFVLLLIIFSFGICNTIFQNIWNIDIVLMVVLSCLILMTREWEYNGRSKDLMMRKSRAYTSANIN